MWKTTLSLVASAGLLLAMGLEAKATNPYCFGAGYSGANYGGVNYGGVNYVGVSYGRAPVYGAPYGGIRIGFGASPRYHSPYPLHARHLSRHRLRHHAGPHDHRHLFPRPLHNWRHDTPRRATRGPRSPYTGGNIYGY